MGHLQVQGKAVHSWQLEHLPEALGSPLGCKICVLVFVRGNNEKGLLFSPGVIVALIGAIFIGQALFLARLVCALVRGLLPSSVTGNQGGRVRGHEKFYGFLISEDFVLWLREKKWHLSLSFCPPPSSLQFGLVLQLRGCTPAEAHLVQALLVLIQQLEGTIMPFSQLQIGI